MPIKSYFVEPRPTAGPILGVYLGLEDIAGRRGTPADLFQWLGKHRRSDVIRWITAVSRWVSEDDALSPQNQMAMARTILTSTRYGDLQRYVRAARHSTFAVFHRRQLWLLLQVAVLACREDVPESDEETVRQVIGECCLASSDVLQQICFICPPGEGPEEANNWVTGMMVPFLEAKSRLEVLARAWSFWFDIPTDPVVRARFAAQDVANFEDTFAARYGMSLKEFFLVLFTLNLGFKAHELRDKNPLLLDEARYLRPTFGHDHVRRALALVSQSPDELALKLLGTPRQTWASDLTPLKESPVIQVFDGKYACPDLDLLRRCLTDKVYYLLQQAYPEKAFPQLFGHVFQAYINRFLGRFSYEGDTLTRTFFKSPQFEGKNDEAGDGILAWQRSALVLEYKARLLTTREKYAGNIDATLAGIDDIIGKDGGKKGVSQLAKVISRLLSGEKVVAGSPKALCLRDCPRIHPVLVTYEEAVGLEAVRQRAEAKFSIALEHKGVSRDRVGCLLILTIEEVEILEQVAIEHPVEEVVADYVAYLEASPNDRAGSFHSFICNGKYNARRPSPRPSMVQECFQIAMNQIGEELKRRQPAAHQGETDAGGTPAA